MKSALTLLQAGEICGLILADGQHREGAWNSAHPGFEFCDGKGEGAVFLSDVEEWWPAGVRF